LPYRIDATATVFLRSDLFAISRDLVLGVGDPRIEERHFPFDLITVHSVASVWSEQRGARQMVLALRNSHAPAAGRQ
jgi:hypothetical protein